MILAFNPNAQTLNVTLDIIKYNIKYTHPKKGLINLGVHVKSEGP